MYLVFFICIEFQKKKEESESSEDFSDGEEEDQKDYCLGGYHPVEVCLFLYYHNK